MAKFSYDFRKQAAWAATNTHWHLTRKGANFLNIGETWWQAAPHRTGWTRRSGPSGSNNWREDGEVGWGKGGWTRIHASFPWHRSRTKERSCQNASSHQPLSTAAESPGLGVRRNPNGPFRDPRMQLTHLPLQPKALTLAGESKYGMAIQGQDLRVLDSMHILRAMVFPVVE